MSATADLKSAIDKLNGVVSLAEGKFEEAQKNSIKFVGMIDEIVANKELAIDAELSEGKKLSLLAKLFSGKQARKEHTGNDTKGKVSMAERMSDAQQLSRQLADNHEHSNSKAFSKEQERC